PATRAGGGGGMPAGPTGGRVVETRAREAGTVGGGGGLTRLYLRPGSPIRVVDGLLTNFHQPRSSLLVLLAALIGGERWREAYSHALDHGYRFLSFGDCMLCWGARVAGGRLSSTKEMMAWGAPLPQDRVSVER